MKRKVYLYIGDLARRADIGDESFILLNWSNGDLVDPAQIKNSWSRQITLPGTPNNDLIFGSIYRSDRVTVHDGTGQGIGFDPTHRTPFTVYDDGSVPIESGYLKLDAVEINGNNHSYKVTLYGGIGGFLYSLAYKSDGSKKTLADLTYKSNNNTVQNLDFTISAANVKAAWDFLEANSGYHYLQNNKWDFINFAPAYNGLPRGSFDAQKAVASVSNFGLPTQKTENNVTYSARYGRQLVTFPEKMTEWETRDLRSYLQRPVLRTMAFLEAIADSANNGGYSVELYDTFFNPTLSGNDYVANSWITLPQIIQLELTVSSVSGTFNISNIPTFSSIGQAATIMVKIVPNLNPNSLSGTGQYYLTHPTGLNDPDHPNPRYVNKIELSYYGGITGQPSRYIGGDVLCTDAGDGVTIEGSFDEYGVWFGPDIIVSWRVDGDFNGYNSLTINVNDLATVEDDPLNTPMWRAWDNPDDDGNMIYLGGTTTSASGSYAGTSSTSARSFVSVPASTLLKTEHTPADYLLSFMKIFDLRFIWDAATKKVTIVPRGVFYNSGASAIDISRRINRSKTMTKTPISFDHRWYAFGMKYANGDYAQYYANLYGRTFGVQRVNTGYEFNASTKDVMADVIYKGAAQILEYSKYYCDAYLAGNIVPGCLLNAGATYELYSQDGKTLKVDVPVPEAVSTYLNPSHPTFDLFDKPQFHNVGNAAYDERDTLLFFNGMQNVSGYGYRLSDDTSLMLEMNNNTPCWDLIGGTVISKIPKFSRYGNLSGGTYYASWDFGTPAEIPIPGISFYQYATIYSSHWETFIADRYDDDSAVMRCYVNLEGLGVVGQELLRSFYYFEDAIWSMNKIINYSMTTWDDTECEFVRVQDKVHY